MGDKKIKIRYGVDNLLIDVTTICLSRFKSGNNVYIPSTERLRAKYFTDPLIGVHKKIVISIDGIDKGYDEDHHVMINLVDMNIVSISEIEIEQKLKSIHDKLSLKYGILEEELPEQKMAIRYLTGNERILEIGGNVGRNSLVIASILADQTNLVVLESNTFISKQLEENKDINGLLFHIENAALSRRRLIQNGWDTKPSEILEDNHFWVNIISFDEIQTKYNLIFDTLILDCEGAFYYILQDFPDIFKNIKLIIIENDYADISHKNYVDDILKDNHFQLLYVEPGGFWVEKFKGLWNNFFEVWKKF